MDDPGQGTRGPGGSPAGFRTRLITRVRLRYDWTSPTILFNLALDVGDIVMMRRCLLGIKRRAEALARSREIEARG